MSPTPKKFDPKAFVREEKKVIEELLSRFYVETAEDVKAKTFEALELAAGIAAAKLAGDDTTVAVRALLGAKSNLFSLCATRTAMALLGYMEGALYRAAKVAAILL